MPIRIQDNLPAARILESENIFVMTEHRAAHQDIRPLQIVILNLMPTKVESRDAAAAPAGQLAAAGGY